MAGLTIANNKLHHAGQYAISSSGSDLEVLNNEIYENNTEDFDTGWAAGGMKVAGMVRLLANGNDIHHNPKGIWTDVGAENVTITNNRIHHNDVRGIDLEITDNVEVSGNAIYENGWVSGQTGLTGAGILLKSVRDADIRDNTVAWNDDGITVLNPERTTGVGANDPRFDLVYNVHIHHNDIFSEDVDDGTRHVALGWLRGYPAGNLYDPAANNRGNDNRYFYHNPESAQIRYRWESDLSSLDAFNATPGEERGRYLSDAEKNAAAGAKNVPASPERTPPPPPPSDTTAPSATAAPSPEPNAAGWSKADVVVTLSATDETGVASISYSATGAQAIPETTEPGSSARIDVTTEGETEISYFATDQAGNTSPAKTLTVKLDKTAPTATLATPPEGASYSRSESVNADYTCADEPGGSGVKSCDGPVASGAAIDTSSAGAKTFTVTAEDVAGNTASVSHGYEVSAPSDATAPSVNCAAADTLWHRADVSIACTAGDDGSGLADPADANFSLSTSVPAGTETADARTGTRQVCDVAGNCATAGPVGGNKVDKKAPAVTLTTPPAGAVYTLRQSVLAAYDCSDGGSGVASCAGPVANGNAIDTASVGAKNFVVNASDEAGNTATLSRSYEVRYAFSGFFQPVDNLPTINVMRAGDAVPVIFSLSGNQGLSIFDAGSPSSTRITCPTAPSDDIEKRVNANTSNLSYAASTDRYTYAWKTNSSWKGTCRQLTLKLKDGSVRQANFRFR